MQNVAGESAKRIIREGEKKIISREKGKH